MTILKVFKSRPTIGMDEVSKNWLQILPKK